MSTKEINARVLLKYDTAENWAQATFTPKRGEMIIYAPDEEKNIPVRYKIGDGETPIYDLPFVTTSEGDVTISQFKEQFAVGDTAGEISSVTEWATATSPSGFTQRQRSCCYGNGYYVIAGLAGQMVYSTNGIDWTLVTPFTSDVITGLAYGNGRFVAVDSAGKIFSAALPSDTWSQVYTNPVIIESVRYLNNRFIAVGENGFFATSNNAFNWTQQTVPTTNTLIDAAYGNGYYIAVGHAGTIIRSINLIDWFDYSMTDFGDIRTAMFTGNGFVIGGQGGKIAYSADGATWSMATNNTTSSVNWIRAFAYAEKRIYAVMYISTGAGEIWVSKDNGATWTVDKSVAGRLWCIVYGNGRFITSGDNGAIYTLDLDIDWTDEEPSEGASIWHRYITTLSNGDKVISESYKSTPVDGGNADTVDGKHASDFTTVHIGATQPTDGSDFWIDPNGASTSVEDWSFELEDGTNDTKTVVVMDSDDAAEGDKAAILRVKQADGSYKEIPALIGSKGDPGTPGSAATVEIGSVTTGAAGSDASVTNSGTAQAAKLNFTIPKGEKGDPGNDGIASVTTTGSGNVITGLSYNESTKVLTATKGTVTAEDLGLTSPMEFIGTSDISIEDGDVTNPITISGVSTTVSNGNVAIYGAKEFIWNGSAWEEFGNEGNYKIKQQSNSKTATATQTIKSISQNENGDVTVETQDIAFPVTSVNGQTGDVTIDIVPITVTSTDGVTYAATVPFIKATSLAELKGAKLVIIPNMTSTNAYNVALNVNGLGEKAIKRWDNTDTSEFWSFTKPGWFKEGYPITVTFNGTYWMIEGMNKPYATDLSGTVPIANGGTGATTAAAARTNLGLQTENWTFTLEDGTTVTKAVYIG